MLYQGYNYIVLFFIYGLSFFSLGISALQQKNPRESSFILLKSIRYLGFFGVIHGLAEWLIMLRLTDALPEHRIHLIVAASIANALSFAFLWYFGMIILEPYLTKMRSIRVLPFVIFFVWAIVFITTYSNNSSNIIQWLIFENTLSRYFIGLPGGLFTAAALKTYADNINSKKTKKIAAKLRFMSALFLLYGILAGLVVSENNFFLATFINSNSFYRVFGFPVELGRTIAAVSITIVFVGAIDVFRWELDDKIDQLTKDRILSRERRKLGRELHDGLIQLLFATGLQLENIFENEHDINKRKQLDEIKNNLNSTISKVRDFIDKMSLQQVSVEDLEIRLLDLIENFSRLTSIPIHLDYLIPDMTIGSISSEDLTQLFYIIQEAISNSIKHSNPDQIKVSLYTKYNSIIASIEDDGEGFEIDQEKKKLSYGLTAMNERAESIGAKFSIVSSEKGTVVTVKIPWGIER